MEVILEFKIYILYIHMKWFFVRFCLFVSMYGTFTNSHFWTNLNQTLHTSCPWSGRDCRVCMGPKFLISSTFWALFLGATAELWAQDGCRLGTLISVVPAGVCVTSPTLGCRRRRIHPWQPYFPDSSWSSSNVAEITSSRRQSHPLQRRISYSSGCSRHVTDITFNRTKGPSATALYPSI
jgi:hypothetical protein